ncbi:tRNA (guanine-N(1)-)-methyltransferase (chromatophore) [Paulinella micropora]|uniref:tRNA (guanine-N(1)-)-methyltransferase n=1 Tax=Paulinella micropora TaxID=1928728 RepID=A0A1L5YAX7_9EUKA|nr:tRNA (guanine-N(1)-)-methyltransferase [Paulinella micropora]AQX44617.1 tRNA (guanine-N(1)-)-methyltransferase [Paulinella micropora]BBL85824.1 tRNA (guanine-N(1)-)-methyltransferase [Paulinella micropora]
MTNVRFDVITLAPQAIFPLRTLGVIGKAFRANIAELYIHNPRDYAEGNYRKVDDEPYGGGTGMLLKPEPVFATVEALPIIEPRRTLLMSPQGKLMRQADLQRWANTYKQLILICGHYEGFDERIRILADEEVSVGDFVLTGGELPAMLIINGTTRLLPGTLGKSECLTQESHSHSLLEYPHYTRPARFREMEVPDVLRNGDHQAIQLWRTKQQKLRTVQRRPDLLSHDSNDN